MSQKSTIEWTDAQPSLVFDRVVTLALATGAENIGDGLWTHDVDARWRVAVTGRKAHSVDSLTIPPFHLAVWFNGWLAGFLSPFDGAFAAGSAANEDTFLAAIDAAILRVSEFPAEVTK